MTHPGELQARFAGPGPGKRIAIGVVLLSLLVGAAFFARPAWRALKDWRAAGFATAAAEAESSQQLGEAIRCAQAGLQLKPHDPDLIRLNARLLALAASDVCLKLWMSLATRTNATPEDRFSYAEAALAFQRTDLAGPVLSNLNAVLQPTARLHRLTALYSHGVGASNFALARARAALQLEPANPTNALLAASLLALSPRPADVSEGRALLRNVAGTPGPLQPMARRRLVQSPIGERSDYESVRDVLTAKSTRSPEEEVLLAESQIRLDPSSTRAVISNLIPRIPHDDVPYLTLAVEMLARLDRPSEVIDLTLAHRALQHRSLFLARFEALVALGRTEEAYRLLLEPGAPIPAFDLSLAKVKAAAAAKDSERRDSHLLELSRQCDGNPTRLRAVAELAEFHGALAIASETWKQLGSIPGFLVASSRALQRIADRRGDTWGARDVARNLWRSGVTNTALRLEIAQYNLLLSQDVDQALADAETVSRQQPADFYARAVTALGHLRQGNPKKARDALERFFIDDHEVRPDALAVLSATCGENGLSIRARDIASRIPLDRLRPEERELVRPWLTPPAPAPDRVTNSPGPSPASDADP